MWPALCGCPSEWARRYSRSRVPRAAPRVPRAARVNVHRVSDYTRFLLAVDNLFLLSHLCSSGHGAWGQCAPCWGASKPPRVKQIMVDLRAQLPKTCLRLSNLGLSQGGRFAEGSGKRQVKSGHVVGLGSSLVLNPSRESKPIGYVDNSGRLQSEARRCTHGAGWKRFLRLQCTSLLTRAEKVDLPA